MEAFSLLKFWKSSPTILPSTTLLSSVSDTPDASSAPPDDGPFFDLEFTAPDDSDSDSDDNQPQPQQQQQQDDDENDEDDDDDKSVAELVCLEDDDTQNDDVPSSGPAKTQLFPVSLVRSATRLRILMAGFKKSSSNSKPVLPVQDQQTRPDPKQSRTRKLFTIKFKPGEVPIVSLFTNNTSRGENGVVSSLSSSSSSSSSSTTLNCPGTDSEHPSPVLVPPAETEEKPNPNPDPDPKDGVQKYLKMVKPLYIRVSKRYGEKLGLSGQLSSLAEAPGGLKVMMRKRLSGKSKTPEVPVVGTAAAAATGRQRDDSLVQQQEWIQGAILHCKRSLNASRDEEKATVLCRSASDPSHGKTVDD